MKRSLLHLVPYLLAAALLTNCATPEQKGWHRPAKPGDRIGQIMEVKGAQVSFVISESCEVHVGDVLSLKRVYCKPVAGQKDMKGCEAFESGTITVQHVNAEDHVVMAKLREGTAVVDSPVYMMKQAIESETLP